MRIFVIWLIDWLIGYDQDLKTKTCSQFALVKLKLLQSRKKEKKVNTSNYFSFCQKFLYKSNDIFSNNVIYLIRFCFVQTLFVEIKMNINLS